LIIEDDDLVGRGLRDGLQLHDFVVDWLRDAGAARLAVRNFSCDAIILDLGLPDGDGLALLREWRDAGLATPVLILTARDALSDRVAGLDAGADDYVLKPFELDELAARLRALQRRASGHSAPKIRHGALLFRPDTLELWFNGEPVNLSRRELALLEKLLNANGRILSEDQLKDGLYGMGAQVESNALNVHIHHLRRKLGPSIVETVRGVGYRLGAPPGSET
jgi:DNA-binding response OmpR family regulator